MGLLLKLFILETLQKSQFQQVLNLWSCFIPDVLLKYKGIKIFIDFQYFCVNN